MVNLVNLKVLIAVIFSDFICVLGQYYNGDPCTTSRGISGTCKFLTQCQSALDDIRMGRYPSDICGFVGTQSIVCCIGSTTVKPPITTTTRSTTTTTTRPTTTTRRPGGKVGDRAAEMCKAYAQYAYEISDSPSLSIFSTTTKELECAFEKEALIVGGRKASRKEFPHMTQIGYVSGSDVEWGCGGSLISENVVLTAGHCLWSQSMGAPKIVRAGVTNVSDTNHLQTRNVQKIIRHPEYINQKYNDIALLKMDRNFEMNPYVRPACVYTQTNIPVKNAIASGWGRIEYSGEDSKDLLKVVLEFFSTAKCNTTYRRDIIQPESSLKNGIVESMMICAGSSKEFRDTCQGDSGGPLQVYHEDTPDIKCMYNIIGVTSFGKSCGLAKNVPGVYTRVSNYVKWIEDNVWPR